jgi:CheY-like chemotaxis protein
MAVILPQRSILIVDDRPEQGAEIAALLENSLPSAPGAHRPLEITLRNSSHSALVFLHHESPTTHLLLLNLDLPEQQGYELLQATKADPLLRRIPIVAFCAPADSTQPTRFDRQRIMQTYALRGNCHIITQTEPEQWAQTVQRIAYFWLEVVTLSID